MTAHNRKLKVITLDVGGTAFEAQVASWTLTNATDDPTLVYVFAEGEEFAEDADPSYTLDVTFFADWRANGISDYLWSHDGQDVTFQLDHHPDIPAEHVRWTGTLHVKAPNVGGDVRTTEQTQVTFQCVGTPVYSRP